jgi:hypothetical protein
LKEVIALVLLVYAIDFLTDRGAVQMVRSSRSPPAWSIPMIKSLLIALMTTATTILGMFALAALMAIPALVAESAAVESAGRTDGFRQRV